MERGAATVVEPVLRSLASRGWRLRDVDDTSLLIQSTASSGGGSRDAANLLAAVEQKLLNVDLRSLGEKSLPDPPAMKKLSHLNGPLILQVVSARDIYKSSIDIPVKDSSSHRRLLRFSLTDGLTEVIAIEYAPIPSINDSVIPGTKVLLENKINIHNGILCLNPRVVTICGGLVQSLFEEWQMNQKYSGSSRSNFKLPQDNDGMGPPPFEKLQLEECSSQTQKSRGAKKYGVSTSENEVQSSVLKTNDDQQMGSEFGNGNKPNSAVPRQKEAIEALPIQNQAAAQKLLQKISQPVHDNRHHKGQKYKGKGKQEETAVFTLDEWERRKAPGVDMTGTSVGQDVSRDEELARQLQSQLDVEDEYGELVQDIEAEQIKMSMFNYQPTGEMTGGRFVSGRRGRGRGRGRWRGGGRMRGRFD